MTATSSSARADAFAVPAGRPRPMLGDALSVAHRRGSSWLRDVLDTHGVASLSAMSDEDLTDAVATRR